MLKISLMPFCSHLLSPPSSSGNSSVFYFYSFGFFKRMSYKWSHAACALLVWLLSLSIMHCSSSMLLSVSPTLHLTLEMLRWGRPSPHPQRAPSLMEEALGLIIIGFYHNTQYTQLCPTTYLVLIHLHPSYFVITLKIESLTFQRYHIGLGRVSGQKSGRLLESSSPTQQLCDLMLDLYFGTQYVLNNICFE